MREIKFKLFDNGMWLYRNLSDKNWYNFKGKYVRTVNVKDKHLDIKQFTGLKDKNGVDIYDGDILKNDIDEVLLNWVVCHNGFSFTIKNLSAFPVQNEREFIIDDSLYFVDRIIIGNIHQNPELLEQQQ